MKLKKPDQRLYASLIILGAGVLLYRAVTMINQGSLRVLVTWVAALLFLELLIDLSCFITSIPWWISKQKQKSRLPLILGATAAIVHAVRVLIFILGRIGPFINFDVRQEQRELHASRWNWNQIYFAGALSILGILGVIIIFILMKRAQHKKQNQINP